MFEQAWDTSAYRNRVGQIRIVDAGSTYWAHINVDHIRFSWDTQVCLIVIQMVQKLTHDSNTQCSDTITCNAPLSFTINIVLIS